MIVQKVLNNSLVLSMDDDNREVIVMGKGIGFNSRPGDAIAPEKIEKLFVTQALGARSGYLEALSAIPDEVIEMAAMIISRANMQLASKVLFRTACCRKSGAFIRSSSASPVRR